MSDTRILRYEVPVDDQWHVMPADAGLPLHTGCRSTGIVEFWSIPGDGPRAFRVFATGQPVPVRAVYHGTAIAPGGYLVWHLLSVPAGAQTS